MYFALANIVHSSWDKSTRTFAGDLNFELQFKFPALAQRPGYNKQIRAARVQHVFPKEVVYIEGGSIGQKGNQTSNSRPRETLYIVMDL